MFWILLIFTIYDLWQRTKLVGKLGKILAKEVSNSKGLMLLSEGTVLKKEHIDKLHGVAGVLLEKEKIDGEEFDQIFNS